MPINNRKTPASAMWREYPLEKWNVTTFHSMISDLTREKYGVEYIPTGIGNRAQRWSREKGMIKNAQERYGNAVLKRFIELCFENYKPSDEYPYVTFAFMYTYMDRYLTQAQSEIAREARRKQEQVNVNDGMSTDEIIGLM